MTTSQDTAQALQAAVDAVKTEQTICGGVELDQTLAALQLAQMSFEQHEKSEDHIDG